MKKVRPFLKWAGNKYGCLDKILPHFPKAQRLIEPFAGSGVVFLNADCASYLIAEANADIIQLFKYLQKEGEGFIHYCKTFFSAETNKEEIFYRFREQYNTSKDSKHKAALFLYLNRHGYNGLCRYNSQGGFNVPFGRYIKPYFPTNEMLYFYKKSQSATFIQSDFRKTFLLAQPGDLIYCDPPYVPLSESARFTAYTKTAFAEKEQIELAELAREAASNGATVIISNHDTAFTRLQYQGAEIKNFLVNRFISCNAEKRLPARELIAIYTPEKQL